MTKIYEMEEREDPRDRDRLKNLKVRIFHAQQTVERGFFDLMEGMAELRDSKLYRLDNLTFKEFCDYKLNMSYTTVNGLLKIYEISKEYPRRFPEKRILEYGHKKMKTITYGVVKILRDEPEKEQAELRIDKMLAAINSNMTAPQIDEVVKTVTSKD